MRIKAQWLQWASVKKLVEVLSSHKTQLFFVGGCIRDTLFGLPIQDIDIAISDHPLRVLQKLKIANIKTLTPGIDHGTVIALIDDCFFEITSFRKDILTDGRHAKITYTEDWKEDAQRRDFTINALYCDVDGRLYDNVNGYHDLQNNIIRFVGNPEDRIQEDYLRIFRFFRFFSRFGKGEPDPKILEACQKYASKIYRLSKERITLEFKKIILENQCIKSISYMKTLGVFKALNIQNISIDNLQCLLDIDKNALYFDRFMALFIFAEREEISAFQLTRKEKNKFYLMQKIWKTIPELYNEIFWKKCAYFQGKEFCLSLYRIYQSQNKDSCSDHNMEDFYQDLAQINFPKFPMQGIDLKILGLSEGPQLGKLLLKTEAWWLENNCRPSYKDCLRFASHHQMNML